MRVRWHKRQSLLFFSSKHHTTQRYATRMPHVGREWDELRHKEDGRYTMTWIKVCTEFLSALFVTQIDVCKQTNDDAIVRLVISANGFDRPRYIIQTKCEDSTVAEQQMNPSCWQFANTPPWIEIAVNFNEKWTVTFLFTQDFQHSPWT